MPIRIAPSLWLASFAGLLYPLYFPNLDMGWLAWIGLIPLHIAIKGLPIRSAFFHGWLAGFIAFTGSMYWVVTAMHLYGHVPLMIATLIMFLLTSYLGLYFACYAWGISWITHSIPNLAIVAAPSLWVALEFLRTYLLSGLPWVLLGYSQYSWLPIIQIADITGIYGVSFLIVLINVALVHLFDWSIGVSRASVARGVARAFPWRILGIAGLIFVGTIVYGAWRLHQETELNATASFLTVGLVQANIDQAQKWDEAYREATLRRYTRLSAQVGTGVDLLIWPEAATPFLFEQEPHYQHRIMDIVRQAQAPLLFGSPALRYYEDGHPYLLNSAYLVTPAGHIAGRYDKRHLVPFGEYIPLRSLLFFLEKLVVGIGDFAPGRGPMTLTLPATEDRPSTRFGVAICYEVIFPDLVRRMALEGATFLVTITNDAWFGESVAPYQHFGMVVFRAVENRRAFARAANTGISGLIAPSGEILAATPLFSEQVLRGQLPLRTHSTFYSRYGDVFSWSCVIMGAVCLGFAWRRRAMHRRFIGNATIR